MCQVNIFIHASISVPPNTLASVHANPSFGVIIMTIERNKHVRASIQMLTLKTFGNEHVWKEKNVYFYYFSLLPFLSLGISSP